MCPYNRCFMSLKIDPVREFELVVRLPINDDLVVTTTPLVRWENMHVGG